MLGSKVFQRFLNESPICVMVRAALENVFAPNKIDAVFERAAEVQYQRELTFSTMVDVMSLVVCRIVPSVHAAFQRRVEDVGVKVQSLYDKLKGVEPQTSRELVRHTAREAAALIRALRGGRTPLLPGYRVKILDGNHLQGSHHRIGELRGVGGGALPGLCLAVLDAQTQTICDAIPCEDAHTQECRLLDQVLETIEPKDVIIADRLFCVSHFLFTLMARQAFFVVRQHAGHLRIETLGERQYVGRTATGKVYEQAARLTHPQTGEVRRVRRVILVLDKPTRDGDAEIAVLTNLPVRDADAIRVAELYRERWTVETAFLQMTTHLRCELNSLGYPPAALFGFCTAAACYNVFAVIWAALRGAHGEAKVELEVSNFYLTEEVSATYRGMMIALPPEDWTMFQDLPAVDLARLLKNWAAGIDLSKYRKHRRAPKTRVVRPKAPRCYVATARLLQGRKRKSLANANGDP